MPARETVKMIADRMRDELPATLDALPMLAGERPPQVARFLDPFTDDGLESDDDPSHLTDLQEGVGALGGLETQGLAEFSVPFVLVFRTRQSDTAAARRATAFWARGCLRVLSDLIGTTLGGVRLVQVTDAQFQFFTYSNDRFLGGAIFAEAQVRDEEW